MKSYKEIPEEFEKLKDKYDFNCPSCKKELTAKPSLAMWSGYNSGVGNCLDCKALFHLEIDEKNERMIAVDWDTWLALSEDEADDE